MAVVVMHEGGAAANVAWFAPRPPPLLAHLAPRATADAAKAGSRSPEAMVAMLMTARARAVVARARAVDEGDGDGDDGPLWRIERGAVTLALAKALVRSDGARACDADRR